MRASERAKRYAEQDRREAAAIDDVLSGRSRRPLWFAWIFVVAAGIFMVIKCAE